MREHLTIWAGPAALLSGSALPWPARVVVVPLEDCRAAALRVDGVRELLGERGLDLDAFGSLTVGGYGRGVELLEHLAGDPETLGARLFLAEPEPVQRGALSAFWERAARLDGSALVLTSPATHAHVAGALEHLPRYGSKRCAGELAWLRFPSASQLVRELPRRLSQFAARADCSELVA